MHTLSAACCCCCCHTECYLQRLSQLQHTGHKLWKLLELERLHASQGVYPAGACEPSMLLRHQTCRGAEPHKRPREIIHISSQCRPAVHAIRVAPKRGTNGCTRQTGAARLVRAPGLPADLEQLTG